MSKKAALLLAPGFEEAEAFITLDILSRLGVVVTTIACHPHNQVVSYHGVVTLADRLLEETLHEMFDAVIIPGGPEGTMNLAASPAVSAFIRRHDEAEKIVAPICSAAARVLAGNGLLKGRRYTCSGELWMHYEDGEYVMADVVEDGNLLSGRGLGVAFDFALQLALRLTGKAGAADFQAEHIYYDRWRSDRLGNS
ncbi:MAG: DJ-1/PfpI family protein [Pantoea sp.]|uniref:DJ-1/PfpI family protein n=1 Tax=Pantoea septica TaxID=472695 RepID=UPI000534943A|nr:DJ-1/PfpI family protein [Pantoea septica]MBU5378824.1 DJ-1/PfpI family protein [Pantoea septica]MDU5835541.1 DJ-1/PfpI family protein [Pantoea sp.]MDU6441326.1 DJ-1/PfpI family protein [Pantoea sp.]